MILRKETEIHNLTHGNNIEILGIRMNDTP